METPAQLDRAIDAMLGKVRRTAPQVGPGQKRAARRRNEHRKAQASRVASALPALANKRAALARRRVQRWMLNNGPLGLTLADAPGHIKAMSREQRSVRP